MRKRTILIGAGSLAIVVAIVLLFRYHQRRRQPARTESIERADRSYDQRLARQEARITQLMQLLYKRDMERARSTVKRRKAVGPKAEPPAEPKIDYTKYAAYHFDSALPRNTRVALYIDEQIDKQVRDEKWATATEKLAASAVAAWNDRGVYLDSAKCGEITCRVTITTPDRETRDRFLGKTLAYPPFKVHGYVHLETMDDKSFEVYFSREGYRVPELPRDPPRTD